LVLQAPPGAPLRKGWTDRLMRISRLCFWY
jgi:hypothetical protein